MDLIDIVFKSLTYFGILAVIVIIGSYVSYRVRKRLSGERLPYEDELEKVKEAEKAQKAAAKNKKKGKVEEKEEDRDLKKPVILHKEAKKHVHVKKSIKDNEENERKKLKEEAIRKQKSMRHRKRKPTQIFSRKHRIEILNKNYSPSSQTDTNESKTPANDPIHARRTEEVLNPKKKKKLQSLDDNVLDKYAADGDDEFYTIKPGNKNK